MGPDSTEQVEPSVVFMSMAVAVNRVPAGMGSSSCAALLTVISTSVSVKVHVALATLEDINMVACWRTVVIKALSQLSAIEGKGAPLFGHVAPVTWRGMRNSPSDRSKVPFSLSSR